MITKLSINPTINNNAYKKETSINTYKHTSPQKDTFTVSSPVANNNTVSFGGLFSSLFVKKAATPVVNSEDDNVSDFAKTIADSVNKAWGTNFPAKNFSCVVGADEFKEILPNLKSENFEFTEENAKSGVYCADLDNQTNHSNGIETVGSLMNKVAKFANKYHQETGKDFIFAITDRDSLEGTKHAMRLIGETPGKFKHVKFVPGVKMSFAHKAPSSSSVGYENSEMLVYGINPFSENINEFMDFLIDRRKCMVGDFIRSVHELYPQFEYSIQEFAEQNDLLYQRDYTVSNLYWRAKEYSEKKGGDTVSGSETSPEQTIADAASLFNDLDKVFLGSNLADSVSSIQSTGTDANYNLGMQQVFDEYSTHYDAEKGKEVSAAENIYADMIECLSKEEQKPVMALAAPYYFSHYFKSESNSKTYDNVIKFFNVLQEHSDGMLCAFESVVPSYGLDNILGDDTVEEFNDHLRNSPKCNLHEVGGSFHRIQED